MLELITAAQLEADELMSQEPVLNILKATYGNTISLQSSDARHIEVEGRDPIPLTDIKDGLWEDVGYLDDFIAKSNHREFPSTRVVRALAFPCEIASGPALLVVASKDFRLVFDDIDSWFTQTCANILSQTWHKHLLAEVMRAKEQFLRGISHHLRTPIHGILGSVELLAEELMSAHKLRENEKALLRPAASVAANTRDPVMYLETIRAAGRDLMSIVNSMITLNHWADVAVTDRDHAERTPHELEAALVKDIDKATLGETRYKPATVFFNHNHPADCDRLRTDLGLLRESLLPLIINAIQNTPAGAVMISMSLKVDCREFVVDIEDTGRGIHPDDQERIFEPYGKSSECATTGAGLGLTLASKFATLLHGTVALVASAVDRGSHFRVVFQEVNLVHSTPTSPQTKLTGRLTKVPSSFYVMPTAKGTALCDYFTRFLTNNGLKESASADSTSLILFDYEDDWEQHCRSVSQVPPEHVAICLIPTSVAGPIQRNAASNIMYLKGPFSSLTLMETLEELDRRLEEMAFSNDARLLQADASSPSSSALKPPSLVDSDTDTTSSITSLESIAPDLADEDVLCLSSACATNAALVVEEATAVTPLFAALTLPNPTALLVDDNVVNLRIMQMYCQRRKLSYHCATDGAQAVATFSQQQTLMAAGGDGQGIQMIFMDLQMPVCDGFEATRQIRQLEREHGWTESTIFIVTGQDSPSDRKTADNIGAHEYFVKPVGIKVLDVGVKRYFPSFELGR